MYGRSGKIIENEEAPESNAPEEENAKAQGIRVDGFQQVVDLLKAADPEFRRSLLMRLASQDPKLVRALQSHIGSL